MECSRAAQLVFSLPKSDMPFIKVRKEREGDEEQEEEGGKEKELLLNHWASFNPFHPRPPLILSLSVCVCACIMCRNEGTRPMLLNVFYANHSIFFLLPFYIGQPSVSWLVHSVLGSTISSSSSPSLPKGFVQVSCWWPDFPSIHQVFRGWNTPLP